MINRNRLRSLFSDSANRADAEPQPQQALVVTGSKSSSPILIVLLMLVASIFTSINVMALAFGKTLAALSYQFGFNVTTAFFVLVGPAIVIALTETTKSVIGYYAEAKFRKEALPFAIQIALGGWALFVIAQVALDAIGLNRIIEVDQRHHSHHPIPFSMVCVIAIIVTGPCIILKVLQAWTRVAEEYEKRQRESALDIIKANQNNERVTQTKEGTKFIEAEIQQLMQNRAASDEMWATNPVLRDADAQAKLFELNDDSYNAAVQTHQEAFSQAAHLTEGIHELKQSRPLRADTVAEITSTMSSFNATIQRLNDLLDGSVRSSHMG